jgi:hypothetical protein
LIEVLFVGLCLVGGVGFNGACSVIPLENPGSGASGIDGSNPIVVLSSSIWANVDRCAFGGGLFGFDLEEAGAVLNLLISSQNMNSAYHNIP